MNPPIRLDELDMSLGKQIRLHRILYEFGPGKGKAMLLPIDHGIEHGPKDFFDNPEAGDPEYQLKLAARGGYSGIVFHVGLAQKYMRRYIGRVPLVVKINGKTSIPSDDEPLSPLDASVEDAVRMGADAVGYTLYVGSPAQDRDIAQFGQVRRDCERWGMPLIMWAYPRGAAIEKKGGRDSLFAVDYAARVACDLGADMVKLNEPLVDNPKKAEEPKPYSTLKYTEQEALERVIKSAGRTFVMFSGGTKVEDAELTHKVDVCMKAGATGFLFGRNMWQRPLKDAIEMTEKVKEIMKRGG
jgi:fructose-bisphosphate aldolase, class I